MVIFIVKILDIEKNRLERLIQYLSYNKQLKINKFLKKSDKIQSLIGEIIIRTELMEKFNLKNKEINFIENKYGKPRIIELEDFYFNLSHSGSYIVAAISDSEVGIDIEEMQEFQDFKEIAENFFSKEEVTYILEGTKEETVDRFYEIWTLKEAYVKFKGKGLSIPLESFTIFFDRHNNIKVKKSGEESYEFLKLIEILPKYKLALCSFKNNNIIIKELKQDKLINNFLGLIERK
ncbi:4'-phosphopantetheinyl transferase family protein [Clostridium mediterraneense]|uniref:4'-phosphopantetheinyl transferase family protein n=1 Tax=Clostridium mediterraneense TaxID=1805472 RepID=UPI000830E0A6|nr:4'-phosphopantetheinyl transferase superfamily protein [Clostridium mediterraneense]